jgi:peptide/nickel transport system ATP-binding protein
VSALDISVQSQIVNLLRSLQRELGLTYLFIAHGLDVVRYISDRIGVMYLGQLVELAPAEELFKRPAHPYTKALLDASPSLDPDRGRPPAVQEIELPSPINPPSGCRYHTRCPFATSQCRTEQPQLRHIGTDRYVACHLPLVEGE